jgi:hypothetical protein
MAAASHDDPAVRVMLAVRGEDNLWGRRPDPANASTEKRYTSKP